MKRKFTLIILLGLSIVLFCGISSCKKDEYKYMETLQQLYKVYKNGQISECRYKGQVVFRGDVNAYDVGSSVYDKDGNLTGVCNYAYGDVDTICWQLTDCEVIYRVKDNIWGKPPVDKYGIGN